MLDNVTPIYSPVVLGASPEAVARVLADIEQARQQRAAKAVPADCRIQDGVFVMVTHRLSS